LSKHKIVPKVAELGGVITSFNPDIVVGTKTWLSLSVFSSELFPSNYTVYQKDRNNHSGSVLTVVMFLLLINHQSALIKLLTAPVKLLLARLNYVPLH